MNILILTYEYRDAKGSLSVPSYPDAIKKCNPSTHILFYKEIYEEYGYRGIREYLTNFVNENNIQVIIYFDSVSFELDIDFFKEIGKNRLMVMYTGDDCYYYDVHFKYSAQAFDFVFTNIIFGEYKYRELNVDAQFLVPAFDTSVYFPRNPAQQDIDVSFIGGFDSVRSDRRDYINFLIQNGIKVEIWGNKTPNGRVSTDKKIEIYGRSKINLDFSGLASLTFLTRGQEIHSIKKHPKGRILELALTKSFIMEENAPGLERYLEPGKELISFKDKADLLEKIKYYLAHPEERAKIAQNAYERAIRNNSLEEQSVEVLETLKNKYREISEEGKRNLPMYIGKEYKKNSSCYRINCMMRFIVLRKYSFACQEFFLWLKYPSFDFLQFAFFLNQNFAFVRNIRNYLKKIVSG